MSRTGYIDIGAGPILSLFDVAPAFLTTTTAWRLSSSSATVSIGERAQISFTNLVGVATFGSAVEAAAAPFPNGGWRWGPFTGSIPADVWDFQLALRSNGGATAPSVRGRWRVFRGAASNASGAVELTSGAIIGTETGSTATATTANAPATWSAPQVDLDNEYLFFSFALEARSNLGVTGANFRDYAVAEAPASRIIIPDLGPIEVVGMVMI